MESQVPQQKTGKREPSESQLGVERKLGENLRGHVLLQQHNSEGPELEEKGRLRKQHPGRNAERELHRRNTLLQRGWRTEDVSLGTGEGEALQHSG